MAVIYYIDKNNNFYIDRNNNFYIESNGYKNYYMVMYINGKFRKVKPYIMSKQSYPNNSLVTNNDELFLTQNGEWFVAAGSISPYNLRAAVGPEEENGSYAFVKYKPYIVKGV